MRDETKEHGAGNQKTGNIRGGWRDGGSHRGKLLKSWLYDEYLAFGQASAPKRNENHFHYAETLRRSRDGCVTLGAERDGAAAK